MVNIFEKIKKPTLQSIVNYNPNGQNFFEVGNLVSQELSFV